MKKLSKCPSCDGQGTNLWGIVITDIPCGTCGGSGWVEVEESDNKDITSVNDILNPKTDNNLPEDNVH